MVLGKTICSSCSVYLIFFLILSNVSAKPIPRLSNSTLPRTTSKVSQPNTHSSSTMNGFTTYYYTQTLDHFNYRPDSFTTFQQKYMIKYQHWGGANNSAPIFVYFGAEGPIESELPTILEDWAPQFKALIVYAEHRYYGKSFPFGSVEDAFRNTSMLGYFTTAQALADYAELVSSLKEKLSAYTSPVIVFGGSYGGMLASWFRLKYPHIALGALASSAPIFDTDRVASVEDPYYLIVTKDFKESSESCVDTIRKSWSVINKIASQKTGLSFLSQKFKTCKPVKSSSHLKDYLESMYCQAAQYDGPNPGYVNAICDAIDRGSSRSDILSGIYAGVVAYKRKRSCYDLDENSLSTDFAKKGWEWQTCTDLARQSAGTFEKTMFETWSWDLNDVTQGCREVFGDTLTPRLHYIVTMFGGYDLNLALKNFGSNIIFSNGLRDPWSGTGVLENISDSAVAIYSLNGSHCLDIQPVSEDDPDWLVKQRNSETKLIRRWLRDYYSIYRNEISNVFGGSGSHKSDIFSGSKFDKSQSGSISVSHHLFILASLVIFCCF